MSTLKDKQVLNAILNPNTPFEEQTEASKTEDVTPSNFF
jgi:hypothetical protein